jgi:hypothetical protein
MAVEILINGREDDVQGFMLGFCSDGHLGTGPGSAANFIKVTYPNVTAGADQACVKFQSLVAAPHCFVSINGLTAGDCLILPAAGGGTTCVPLDQVGGVAVKVPSADPVFTTLVGVAMDVTLCSGNGYWTRGPGNAQIDMPGKALLYHELVGHALHHCIGDFNAADPEGQAIAEENVLRGILGLPQRTSHEGACGGGGSGNGCYIASAAYGSPIAAEVHELRVFRDVVIRATHWGSNLFDEFHKHYYQISPAIAAKMYADPEMAEIIRAILVHPLMIALRLSLLLPKDPTDKEAATKFATEALHQYADWIRQLPIAASAPTETPEALADDILNAMNIFRPPALSVAFIDNLVSAGVLPLHAETELFSGLSKNLRDKGLAETEIRRIVRLKES